MGESYGSEKRSGPNVATLSWMRKGSKPSASLKLHLWKDKLRSKHVVAFIDNEGSRYLISKGYSSNPVPSAIVHEMV